MAEVLFRVAAPPAPADVYRAAAWPRVGDIYAVKPDGFAWGTSELASPDLRIARLLGIAPADLEEYLVSEEAWWRRNDDPENGALLTRDPAVRTWRKRAYGLDGTKLPGFNPNKPRRHPDAEYTLTLVEIAAAMARVAKLSDPAVAGD